MKRITTILLFACLCAVLFSCQKNYINPELSITAPANDIISPLPNPDPVIGNVNVTIQLSGDWILVNDSTYSTNIFARTQSSGSNYLGQPGDHFHFTADGKLYIREGKNIDTAAYTVTSDKKIIINYVYYQGAPVTNYGSIVDSFDQVGLRANTVTLNSSTITPDGSFRRIINLQR
jgi:hypothetical protein